VVSSKKVLPAKNSVLATAIRVGGRRNEFSAGNCPANNMCYFENNKSLKNYVMPCTQVRLLLCLARELFYDP
jgi:hypothetical protein